ncbi:MAG: hypothetical protein M9949_14290 [Candidatus Kapabacteria bacterium]|nr:hypothetical protein [Candidatus Kapabacteria bacterium]
MKIELKTINISKSKIQQMEYISIPANPNVEVLGWVNMDKKRYVIVKSSDAFYRAEFITRIETEVRGVQFPKEGGGWEFPHLTNITVSTYNGAQRGFSAYREEEKNLELYEQLKKYQTKTESAGQIYY